MTAQSTCEHYMLSTSRRQCRDMQNIVYISRLCQQIESVQFSTVNFDFISLRLL